MAARLDSIEREELVEDLIRRLQEKGIPEGAWLFDLARARAGLREVDDLLRRLELAISGKDILPSGAPTTVIVALVLWAVG